MVGGDNSGSSDSGSATTAGNGDHGSSSGNVGSNDDD
jgi:hypothetical protein